MKGEIGDSLPNSDVALRFMPRLEELGKLSPIFLAGSTNQSQGGGGSPFVRRNSGLKSFE